MILGLLIGNSSLRHGLLDGKQVRAAGRIPWAELEARGRELASLAEAPGVGEAVAGSVRDDLLPRVEALLPRRLLPVALARRDFPLPIASRYLRPDEAGTDRLLNAIAARARAPGRAAVVIDFGTAVAISVVAADGAFAGGLIAAGAGTALEGLKRRTPRLPPVEPAAREGFIQRETTSALSAGLFHQVAGGVRALLDGILGELRATAPAAAPPLVLATGGEAELFAPAVPAIAAVVADLTLEGLAIACASRATRP
jgi:type III pantothenate kinase